MRREKEVRAIVDHYPKMAQVVVLIEEMSELTKAMTKTMRGKGKKADIVEELGDVQLMIYQMMLMFKVDQKMIDTVIDYKLERTLKMINEEKQYASNESGV